MAAVAAHAVASYREHTPDVPASARTAPSASTTLAIMPFRSIPPGNANDPLELGLADVLISRLGQLSNVRVLPLSATERLRTEEPLEAARRLGADRVLTVTLQRDGHTVRAVPRLVSVAG